MKLPNSDITNGRIQNSSITGSNIAGGIISGSGIMHGKITAALALLILAVLMNCSFAFADVEKDEYGAAYVLNEDGTRNYTDVPSQDNEAGSEGAASSMYDSFN